MTAGEIQGLAAHVMPAALHAARLLPVTLLCPFLGGPAVPPLVKVALATALGAAAYAGVGTPSTLSGLEFFAGVGREAALGAVLAFVATVPFEAARAGGRIVDTLRGATLGDLHVAPLRQRESACGDLLSHWTLIVAASVGGDRLVLSALLGTFQAVPVGTAVRLNLDSVLFAGAEVLACAVALGAPAAAGLLAAEVAIAVAARASPLLGVATVAQPARAAVGVLAIGLPAALLAGKLTAAVATSAGLVRLCAGGLP